MRFKKKRSGFSLIEVNMAILIAAGGLISLFALFPVGLRQSVMSTADLHQATFASSFFEAIASNVKRIDNIEEWNAVGAFWSAAKAGTGINDSLITSTGMKGKSDATAELIKDFPSTDPAKDLRFVLREEAKGVDPSGSALKLPAQMIIRIRTIEQYAGAGKTGPLPNRYAVSLLSTHEGAPALFQHNTVYSQEFYFRRRP